MPLSVIIGFTEGDNQVYEDEPDQYAYKVLTSGALQLLKAEGAAWLIIFEFSPSAWRDVQGTRFLRSTDDLEGFFGKANKPAALSRKAVVS